MGDFEHNEQAVAGLTVSCFLITTWCINAGKIEHNVDLSSEALHLQLRSQVENTRSVLQPLSSSATNLARVLSSSKDTNITSFSEIKGKVAPLLFKAFLMVPYASHVSYTDKNGLFFSYFIDRNELVAAYSNSSYSGGNYINDLSWYKQPVNQENGELFGEAIKTCPLMSSDSGWFRETLNDTDGYATVEKGWNSAQELNFLTAARVGERGVVTVGFTVEEFVKFFTSIELNGGRLYLSTKNQKGLLQGFRNTLMTVNDDNSVSFYMVQCDNVNIHIGDVLCGNDDGISNLTTLKIQQTKYKFYCSSFDILGVPSVYALAFQSDGLASLITRKLNLALGLIAPSISIMLILVSAFIFISIRGSRKKIELRSLLEQEKRKSASKSHAIASASHDIRANLAGITSLIEICYDHAAAGSALLSNLKKIESVTDDLLDFLSSILDTSKIEAGKMILEEREFDLVELIEDAVASFYTKAMKKGVDVVWDTCDGSVKDFSQVKGDRIRLKRVLSNLLSNAVKFTSEGHISVRAWVETKKSSENSIIDYNQGGIWNCLSCIFYRNKDSSVELNTATNNQNPKSMEFVFEVEDTGKGIPKEQQQSVFENYVQIKDTETAGGTGLGLGIVQSIVRLMGGDIKIVDKEMERGTCFRFNVFLTVCERGFPDNAGEDDIEFGRNERGFPDNAREDDIELGGRDVISHYANQSLELATFASSTGPTTPSDIKQKFDLSSNSKPLQGKKILIVEDVDMLLKVTCRMVEKLGATIENCVNGEQAVNLVIQGFCKMTRVGATLSPPYDYILMDCEMPEMSGYEATKKIRQMEKKYGIHIPIIALTAHSSGEANKTMEAGMDAHLVKPFNAQVFMDIIQNVY